MYLTQLRGGLTATILCVLLVSCGGAGSEAQYMRAGHQEAAPGAGPVSLPAFPDPHATAGLTEYLINGVATFSRSSGAIDSGSALELDGGSAGYAWGLWAFDAQDNSLDSIALIIDVPAGTEYWLALADFSTGRWDLDGPHAKGFTAPVLSEQHLSPGGLLYIAVIAEGGATTTVEALSVRTINPDNQPPVASLTFPAEEITGLVPHTVHFDASASTDSDGNISHYLWDVDEDGAYDYLTFVPFLTYTFTKGGNSQKVEVSVVDEQGAHDEDSHNISANEPPVIIVRADKLRAAVGEAITFDPLQSYDPDGFMTDLQWDLNEDGIFNDTAEEIAVFNKFFATLSWDSPGIRTVSVQRGDSSGFSGTGSIQITVTGWTEPLTLEQSDALVLFSSLELVNGRPAFAFAEYGLDGVKYVQALDEQGTAWQETITAASSGLFDIGLSLEVVLGHPAIAFQSFDGLAYVRALDGDGSAWDEPLLADAGLGKGYNPSLAVVHGHPAISYLDAVQLDLLYVRAQNATGETWEAPVALEQDGEIEGNSSLTVVDGRPAVSYYKHGGPGIGFNDLKYIRAGDATGSSWPAGQLVDTDGTVGRSSSLANVNGRPAISYFDQTNGTLKYVRALDAQGQQWDSAQSLSIGAAGGDTPALRVIGGKPVIAFRRYGTSQQGFIEALDQNGATWGSPDMLDSLANPGAWCSVIELDGQPAVGYATFSPVELRFVRRY